MQKYKPYKKTVDYSYTLGIFPTLELLIAKPNTVEHVFIAPNSMHSEGIQKILKLCKQHNINCSEDQKTLSRLTHTNNVYAIGIFKKFSQPLELNATHVVLVNPDDAGNLGTIVRTALGFGNNNLAIISPAADIFDPRTIRASMGAILKLNFEYFSSIDDYRTKYQHNLYPFMLNTDNMLSNTTFMKPYSLIFGNEGSGLPETYAALGTPVRIEQSEAVDSLNLAVSVSVALYKTYTDIDK